MSVTLYVSLGVAALIASWLMTAAMRRYALRSSLLDIPNDRSSHTTPTPRGGGVAIVLTVILATAGMGIGGQIHPDIARALLGAGSFIALLGFIDDRKSIPAKWRFLGHAISAVWVLYWLGSIPKLPFLGFSLELGFLGFVLAWLFLVWTVNLFNFMDGIDGLASLEAITVALGGALLWFLTGANSDWLLAVVLAGAVAGFLFWNFPPARIFMGDAGSGFLGMTVGVLALFSMRAQPQLFWSWFILVGGFMVDATITLLRRYRRGERVYEAHRNHAYQYAARQLGSHLPVSLAFAVINVFWLLPVAAAVAVGWLDGIVGVALSYLPLVWLAYRFKAGDRQAQAAQHPVAASGVRQSETGRPGHGN